MNREIVLTGGNDDVYFNSPPRVVWVVPVSGATTAAVSYAVLQAENTTTTWKYFPGPTLDFTTGLPERVLPDYFPCGAVRLVGTAGDRVQILAGETMTLETVGYQQ